MIDESFMKSIKGGLDTLANIKHFKAKIESTGIKLDINYIRNTAEEQIKLIKGSDMPKKMQQYAIDKMNHMIYHTIYNKGIYKGGAIKGYMRWDNETYNKASKP